MIVSLIKKFQIFLFIIFFGFLGAIYHQNNPDKWYVRYELKKSQIAEIYLKSIDETILGINKTYLGKNRFNNYSAVFFADYQINLNNNLEKYRGIAKISDIQISESFISFIIDDIEKADEVVKQIIAQSNKDLNTSIIDRLNIFKDEIISSLNYEKKFRLDDLNLTLEFYKNKKITPLSLSPNASITIDNYILEQEDEKTKQFVKDLKEDLIQYEFYNAVNRFELEILKLNKKNVKDNPALLSLDAYKDKISKEDIFINNGKDKLFNKKPSLKFSILTFGVLGIILYFIIIFFSANRKFFQKLTLRKLLTLPNLK